GAMMGVGVSPAELESVMTVEMPAPSSNSPAMAMIEPAAIAVMLTVSDAWAVTKLPFVRWTKLMAMAHLGRLSPLVGRHPKEGVELGRDRGIDVSVGDERSLRRRVDTRDHDGAVRRGIRQHGRVGRDRIREQQEVVQVGVGVGEDLRGEGRPLAMEGNG